MLALKCVLIFSWKQIRIAFSGRKITWQVQSYLSEKRTTTTKQNKTKQKTTKERTLSYKQQRQNTYHRTCTRSEDSDQPAHSRSLIRIFIWRILDSQGYKVLHADNVDSDQCELMRKLIWVFVGRICPKVSFLKLRQIYLSSTYLSDSMQKVIYPCICTFHRCCTRTKVCFHSHNLKYSLCFDLLFLTDAEREKR